MEIITPNGIERKGARTDSMIPTSPTYKNALTSGETNTVAIIPTGVRVPNTENATGTVETNAPTEAENEDASGGTIRLEIIRLQNGENARIPKSDE